MKGNKAKLYAIWTGTLEFNANPKPKYIASITLDLVPAIAGQGDDQSTGGRGVDTFSCCNGSDTITDFNEAEGYNASWDCENVSRG